MGIYKSKRAPIFGALIVFFFSVVVLAQSSTGVYIGTGETEYSARKEAIRLALQEQVSQLLVADRAIGDTEVIYDSVISTMNGYIESFELIKTETDSSGNYKVTARVVVSKQMLENHIASYATEAGEIDGEGLFGFAQTRNATQAAARMNAEANGYIFRRMFRGYPMQVFQSEVLAVKPGSPGPKQHLVTIEAELFPDPAFVELVMSTVDYLAYGKCESGNSCGNLLGFNRGASNTCKNQQCTDSWDVRRRIQLDYANAFPEEYDVNSRRFEPYTLCYYDQRDRGFVQSNKQKKCFVLKPGVYKVKDDKNSTAVTEYNRMKIAATILDSSNVSVLREMACFTEQAHGKDIGYAPWGAASRLNWSMYLPFETKRTLSTSAQGEKKFYIDLQPVSVYFSVDSREMDMSKADKIHIAPYVWLKASPSRFVDVTSVYHEGKHEDDPCSILVRSLGR